MYDSDYFNNLKLCYPSCTEQHIEVSGYIVSHVVIVFVNIMNIVLTYLQLRF